MQLQNIVLNALAYVAATAIMSYVFLFYFIKNDRLHKQNMFVQNLHHDAHMVKGVLPIHTNDTNDSELDSLIGRLEKESKHQQRSNASWNDNLEKQALLIIALIILLYVSSTVLQQMDYYQSAITLIGSVIFVLIYGYLFYKMVFVYKNMDSNNNDLYIKYLSSYLDRKTAYKTTSHNTLNQQRYCTFIK